ncbi:hypothetical protein VB005_02520 [Metarhizium brunneum]
MAKSSTQREPSMFEHVEGRSAPTCSRCHAVGHARSSRICPLRQQEIILGSSIPQLAEPGDVSLALAGWSAGAENGLACQLEETVCDTSCTGTKEVDQRFDHEVNEELNEDLGYVVSQRMDQKTDEGVLIHGTNETAHDRVEDMIVVQLAPRTLDSDLQTSPKSHDTNSSNREADAMTQRAPSDATIEEETLLPHYAPESIYRRYVLARQAWYDSQPRGSLKTNQAYRRAMGLPLRYQKDLYIWCRDYKQWASTSFHLEVKDGNGLKKR